MWQTHKKGSPIKDIRTEGEGITPNADKEGGWVQHTADVRMRPCTDRQIQVYMPLTVAMDIQHKHYRLLGVRA